MIAMALTAVIGVITAVAFDTASTSAAATDEAVKRVAEVDRFFILFENDMRNAMPRVVKQQFGSTLPALSADATGDYWVTVLRGGLANPLLLPRTETVRVGYRLEEDNIWRDTWYDVRLTDQEEARNQRVLTEVKEIYLRILPRNASAFVSNWLNKWPDGGATPDQLPHAIEVTVVTEDFGEVKRVYGLLQGLDNKCVNPQNECQQ